MFNAPLVAVLVAASIPGLYLLQGALPDEGFSLAFRPVSLIGGTWWPGVLTGMFLHAGWTHAAMNGVGALAFAPPVARLMPGARGALAFLLFYMACGVVGMIGYGLAHPQSPDIVVGASGAVFGLTGAAIRLLGQRGGRLRPLTDRRVLAMSAILMGVNLVVGLIGLAPGGEAAGIAWETHAFGFLFGLLAVGPWSRWVAGARGRFDSRADPGDPDV
ncbi:rhomboid family intramembrane serine protease [Brevundimonas sp. FT23028]|uniref:rhomboid family intramembrane serine protease n=1 Tax=Brevundimonas sp. FT23028 TaxID=3393748 RepID=UPI003B58878A